MDALCEREALAAVLPPLAALARRSTLAITARQILVAADGQQLSLTATDSETWATVQVPADVLTPGRVLLSADILAEYAARVPTAEIHLTQAPPDPVRVSGDATHYLKLYSAPADLFPEAPVPATPDSVLTLDAETLRTVLAKCLPAVARDVQALPAATRGLWIHQEPGCLHLTGSDGARLSRLSVARPGLTPADPVSVPPWIFEQLGRVAEGDTRLVIGDRLARAVTGPWRFTTRLLDGRVPDVSRILSTPYVATAHADARALRSALTRLALLAPPGHLSFSITCGFGPDGIHLTTETESAAGDEWVDATFAGDPLRLSFAFPLLRDAARLAGSGPLLIDVAGPEALVRFRSEEGSAFHLLLPLRQLVPA